MNTENLHQEIPDYLVAYIWSRSIPHSEYGLWWDSDLWSWKQGEDSLSSLKSFYHPTLATFYKDNILPFFIVSLNILELYGTVGTVHTIVHCIMCVQSLQSSIVRASLPHWTTDKHPEIVI
jgi:hypothetical protein